MAATLTCDRCGRTVAAMGQEYHVLALSKYVFGGVSFNEDKEHLDLCDECADKVRWWMQTLKENQGKEPDPWIFSRCRNCGMGFEGDPPNYCPNCGTIVIKEE